MADDEKVEPTPDEDATPTDGTSSTGASVDTSAIQPSMTEREIRDAGLAIDVPFESGEPKPERLTYADLGMSWTPPKGWPPSEGQPEDEDDPNA